MLTFIRRILNSRTGVILALLFLGLIGLVFAMGDATGLRSAAIGGQSATTVVTVGDQTLTTTDLSNMANFELNKLKNGGDPRFADMTMQTFVQQGGLDLALSRQTTIMAMIQFAQSQGIRVGRSLLDNEIIAQIPSIRGLDGKVDAKRYQQLLTSLRITDAQLHDQFAGILLAQMMFGPINGPAMAGTKGPAGMAAPYASMLLEHRTGTIAFIDTKKMSVGAPVTDAEAQAWYKKNIARYTTAERRSARYVVISIDDLRKRAMPTDDELQKEFQAQSARYGARDQYTLKQVVMMDQKSAEALAAKVRGGTAISDAARASGLEAAAIASIDKAKYATQTSSQPLADQVFAAPANGVVGPVKTSLGWVVVHVEKVDKVAAKTLDQVKPELVKELTDKKLAPIYQDLNDQVQNAITNRQSFDEIAATLKLPIQSTPLAGADGKDPEATTPSTPDPSLTGLYQLAFGSETDDDPQIVPFGKEGSFALGKLDKVVAATPKPYATVADQVKKDIAVERQVKTARDVANGILGKVNKGMPLAQAMKETGIALDATKSFDGTRAQVMNPNQQPSSQLILLFKTALKTGRVLEAPYKGGWFIIVVDSITRGDASKDAAAIDGQRTNLGNWASIEYQTEFQRAVEKAVGVKRNEAAIAVVRAQLSGKNADDQSQ